MKTDNNFVKAKIISIGDELLIGQVINTNAAWLGNILTNNGIEVISTLTIGDGEKDIVGALDACSDVEIIVMTGGLGPTADDITKPTLCKYFGTELEFCQDAYDNVMSIFKLRGYQMTERNRGQAYIPKSCTYIPNRYGTAPCMWFEKGKSVYISMPGVPFEMKNVFEQEILPKLLERFKVTPYISKVVMTTGVGESFLADAIKDWEEALPEFLSLAYLPQYGMVRLRLDGRHPDRAYLQQTIDNEIDKLSKIIGQYIFGYDEKPIAEAVLEKLKAAGKTLASAESCTGGTIAKMITAIPGSSDVFKGTVVSYATSVKEEVLGVNHDDVEKYTVVSQQVAEQMATGVRTLLKTDYAVATTGVAGPGGATEENPVGTVWIAVAGPNGVVSKRCNFGKDRGNNIERASITALEMVRQYVISTEIKVESLECRV
ncbi:MAG: competence/damage-inducible protein A [Bacteroidales bacterium]|nr:competence/damage-inducible protein A [Bacteroidales bacterium]